MKLVFEIDQTVSKISSKICFNAVVRWEALERNTAEEYLIFR